MVEFRRLPFFGPAWPSGVCDDNTQAATPVGELCLWCQEPIVEGDQGNWIGSVKQVEGLSMGSFEPIHRECSLRQVVGGIGHLEDHARWCLVEHDPDGGRSSRESSLQVWAWVQERGVPAS